MPTELDQSTLNRICEHYRIRPLRAAERCDKCGGRGSIPSPALGDIRCPDCDDGFRVLDKGLLWAAIDNFAATVSGDGPLGLPPLRVLVEWDATCGLWGNRLNQPWQSSLEAAVLDYRVDWEPTADDERSLVSALTNQKWTVVFRRTNGGIGDEVCEIWRGKGDMVCRTSLLSAVAATLPEGE